MNWHSLTLAEQLGNIGSEVSRAHQWQQHNQSERSKQALSRALELSDKTITDQRWAGRTKELIRMREVLAANLAESRESGATLPELETYFLNFALSARKQK